MCKISKEASVERIILTHLNNSCSDITQKSYENHEKEGYITIELPTEIKSCLNYNLPPINPAVKGYEMLLEPNKTSIK